MTIDEHPDSVEHGGGSSAAEPPRPEPATGERGPQGDPAPDGLRAALAPLLRLMGSLDPATLTDEQAERVATVVRSVAEQITLAGWAPAGRRGDPLSDENERLRAEVARLGATVAALQHALDEARLVQQQLQSYADDFRRTYAESRQRLARMTALYEVSTAINGTADPEAVLLRFMDGLARLVPHDAATIYLLDDAERPSRRRLTRRTNAGLKPPARPNRRLVGRCLAECQALLEGPSTRGQEGTESWTLALPLTAGQRLLGVALIERRGEAFGHEERHLAEMVAAQAAMALQNARLAVTDSLTSLYNRRYFEQALELECERARRSGRPIGLLLIDIDHFKRYNDRFGHQAGDAVLRSVAATLADHLRRTDIVARIGGEEFAAILPENDTHAVAAAAERLRRAVEARPTLVFEGHPLPGVSISVGGTSLRNASLSPRALIRTADQALRQAKRSGRNQTIVLRASRAVP